MTGPYPIRFARATMLDIAYEEHGEPGGDAIVLLHGFPYDPRCYDEVWPLLVAQGHRVIVPYLRGYGATRFLSSETMRSGQQAALGLDLVDLMDALSIEKASLAGYDWGGRAACIVAALWPQRARCLVTGDGYNIQNIPASVNPASPETEHRYWYQYYFHSARGVRGLTENRDALARLLWKLWSPTWAFTDDAFALSAASFQNPDFVDIVIHSYRHRYGYAPGDPILQPVEDRLAEQPLISVPTISLCGADDGVGPPDEEDGHQFSGPFERRILPGVGHNIPQEAPRATAQALLELLGKG
ncbi:alpha/beta hydrolase [Mesorhizobium hungaricum]|jgi:pimeloyl-ACP methyl ester carboxylesterase|uniref:Alpha/beta hydrolase n=1 Tax=Mesorhizobium hungaricum TaxID=1566387 RepID=A0A1C2DEL4_9HYPH|nr:pimeloyl-ACP methyl ester carboxylesterase [Mesorhizobium sp. YL-MeA3-2017]OCX13178.1 alpha/beta hydrolase [Mesorhizobium hungaricum]